MIKTLKPVIASGFAALLFTGAALANPPTESQPLAATEQSADGAISEKVKAAIAKDAALANAQITVETVQGEVRLQGFVGSAADIEKAGAIAGTVAGVKAVKNGLKVK